MLRMYGVTHRIGGEPIIIEPKATKVGIGLPKGKAIHVYIDAKKKWCVHVGKEISRFETRREAQLFYRQAKPNAPDRKYPSKVNYFLFHRIAADGSNEPDWDAIEAHGPIPTEITIVFTSDDPLDASYQYWTATERRCQGDGLSASRILSMASTEAEKKLAATAAQKGERTFPIVDGCWLKGCPYAKPTSRDGKEYPAPCRAHGRLLFQLLASPRLGGTAYFDTTALRSINQLFSCIQIFRTLSGRGDPARGFVAGIPLQLVLRPYRTSHNGQLATQYGVSLEFRAETAFDLKRQLIETGRQYHTIGMGAPVAQIPAGPDKPAEVAGAMAAEFTATPDGQTIPVDPAGPPDDEPEDPTGIVDPEDPWSDMAALAGEEIPPESSPTPGPAPQPSPEWKKFYELCRARGMTDAGILEELGRRGYELAGEVPASAYPDLMRWADSWKPAQKSLI